MGPRRCRGHGELKESEKGFLSGTEMRLGLSRHSSGWRERRAMCTGKAQSGTSGGQPTDPLPRIADSCQQSAGGKFTRQPGGSVS